MMERDSTLFALMFLAIFGSLGVLGFFLGGA